LGHYSNPDPIPSIEQLARRDTATPPPTARRRTQPRLRAEDVDGLVEGYHAGATIKQLAERFSINRTTAMAHLDRRHVQRRRVAKQWDQDALATAADAYNEGHSLAQIANQHDLDPQTVANRLRRAGIKIRPRRGWK
jgi:transposase-like protein